MPNLSYLCTPFTDSQNGPIVAAFNKYRGKWNCVVIDELRPGCLTYMPTLATLIICGHSSSMRANYLSETVDGTGRSVHYDGFKNRLINSGLNPNHVLIRILGCESQFFAANLAVGLGPTHPRIVVGGYQHDISIVLGSRTVIKMGHGNVAENVNDTGASTVQWFSPHGLVRKPAGRAEAYNPWLGT